MYMTMSNLFSLFNTQNIVEKKEKPQVQAKEIEKYEDVALSEIEDIEYAWDRSYGIESAMWKSAF